MMPSFVMNDSPDCGVRNPEPFCKLALSLNTVLIEKSDADDIALGELRQDMQFAGEALRTALNGLVNRVVFVSTEE